MTEFREARDVLERVFERFKDKPKIDPSFIAAEAMTMIEGCGVMHQASPIGYALAHAHMTQFARALCRGKFDPVDSGQIELFDGLQARYPAAHNSKERFYVLLDFMEPADVAFNVARLRKEGQAKIDHADALLAYHQQRLAN